MVTQVHGWGVELSTNEFHLRTAFNIASRRTIRESILSSEWAESRLGKLDVHSLQGTQQ